MLDYDVQHYPSDARRIVELSIGPSPTRYPIQLPTPTGRAFAGNSSPTRLVRQRPACQDFAAESALAVHSFQHRANCCRPSAVVLSAYMSLCAGWRLVVVSGGSSSAGRGWSHVLEISPPSLQARLASFSSLTPSWPWSSLGRLAWWALCRAPQARSHRPRARGDFGTARGDVDFAAPPRRPRPFRQSGPLLAPAVGVLLHGPPGAGKTLLVRRLMNACAGRGRERGDPIPLPANVVRGEVGAAIVAAFYEAISSTNHPL